MFNYLVIVKHYKLINEKSCFKIFESIHLNKLN